MVCDLLLSFSGPRLLLIPCLFYLPLPDYLCAEPCLPSKDCFCYIQTAASKSCFWVLFLCTQLLQQELATTDSVDSSIKVNEAWATSLPPHWPYDCAISLLPGSAPPRGQLYTPSSGAGFFSVDKKDKILRPCFDYHGLNDITIKTSYLFCLWSLWTSAMS